jgi:hypothetical protein
MTVGALLVVAALFYMEENWRGESAWETAKQHLAAQQERLDWAAYVPPPVPDDQNFFKAPKMEDWFAGKGTNELTARLSLNSFTNLAWHRANSNASAVVTVLILRPPGTNAPKAEIFESCTLHDEPLSEAIKSLAEKAHLKVDLDPLVISGRPGPDGKPVPPPILNSQWSNVSALAVLMTVLSDNNLRWVEDPKTGNSVITDASAALPAGGDNAVNRDFVLAMIRGAIGPVAEIADGFPLSGNALLSNPPCQMSIAPDTVPTRNDLVRILPGTRPFQIEPAGNTLRVRFNLVPVAAADYLAWSDQFSPEFDTIRAAVKRPAARLDGDYLQPYRIPTPNLTAVDMAASRLASRATAFLMRGRPADAFRELTLLHDLRGCLEVRPAGKPMALATAMTDVGISGMYAGTISYGLRLQVWRESELAALQAQLSQADVVSPLWSAIESDRASGCHFLDTATRSALSQVLQGDSRPLSFWQKARTPSRVALKFMPRGWVLQNMANLALLDQNTIDAIDRIQGVIHPGQVEAAADRIAADLRLHSASPSWRLVKNMISPMTASLKTAALAQTSVNQALLVCALERFRLARGQYPAALRELAPDFLTLPPLDPVTGEPLKYRPDATGGFLLYSVGWDEKDDNGTPLDAAGKGDWVWGRQ